MSVCLNLTHTWSIGLGVPKPHILCPILSVLFLLLVKTAFIKSNLWTNQI